MTDLDDFDYILPDDLIAQRPLADRTAARMLVVSRADRSIEHAQVRHLAEYLRPGDCLVLNDTRVLPARLQGRRATTGGRWTGLFLAADATGLWQVLGKTRGHLRAGETIILEDRTADAAFGLRMVADLGGGVWAVHPDRTGSPEELLQIVGRVPLPPYIRGGVMEDADSERYQTVFARHPGAVAAPTAGLHFTNELLRTLVDAGLYICRVTLHVGIGTFRPISVQRLEDHVMHHEWGEITQASAEQIQAARSAGG